MTEPRIRPKLADGEHWPEPDRRPWRGPTERGRRLMAAAREALAAAESWRPDPSEWETETHRKGR